MLDAINPSQFSAGTDRRVGQRNIAVVEAHSPAAIDLTLNLGYPAGSSQAEVQVVTEAPSTMEWLKLYAGTRNPVFNATASSVTAGFSNPSPQSPASTHVMKPHIKFHQPCHPLKVSFHAEAPDLKPNDAQILRLRHIANGRVVGGYTVVFVKK
jgi:hypothetical protein